MHSLLDSALALACMLMVAALLLLARPGGPLVLALALTVGCVERAQYSARPEDPRFPVLHCGEQIPDRAYTGCLDCHDDTSRSY